MEKVRDAELIEYFVKSNFVVHHSEREREREREGERERGDKRS